MNRQLRIVILACALLPAASRIHAQLLHNAPAPEPVKPAEQVFKNIQVLKGVPSDQWRATMQFISSSLGVECEFCHTRGAFDNDDKKPKKIARQMIEMQMAINKNNFICPPPIRFSINISRPWVAPRP